MRLVEEQAAPAPAPDDSDTAAMLAPNPWGTTIAQILAARVGERVKTGGGFNPRPPGVAIEGSATTAVLKFMREHPRIWFTHGALTCQVGHSRVAVDWALIRLRRWEFIETRPDPRSPRYYRYRVTQRGLES